MFQTLRDESSTIIDNAINTVYYMRGAVNYFDYYEMTYIERQKISKFLEKRFKEEAKKPPQYNRVY